MKEANLHFMIQCVFFSDEFLMNPALLFIVKRRRMVVVQSRMAVENFWRDWWLGMVDENGRHRTRMVGWRLVGTEREWYVELVTQCNFKFKTHL